MSVEIDTVCGTCGHHNIVSFDGGLVAVRNDICEHMRDALKRHGPSAAILAVAKKPAVAR